jgi:DNA-binding NtrC family response regulator
MAMRILVIEDIPYTRDIVTSFLKREGHDVVEAEDPEAAIRHLAGCNAVICDVHKPNDGGLDVADLCDRLGVPVLLCTGDLSVAGGLPSSEVRHLIKPFPLTALTGWLNDIVSISQKEARQAAELLKPRLRRARFARTGLKVPQRSCSADRTPRVGHL